MPEDHPESANRSAMHSVSDYYSAVQLRADRWSALRGVVGAGASRARGRGC